MVTRDDVEVNRKPRRVGFAAKVVSGENQDDKYYRDEKDSEVGIRANKGIAMRKRQAEQIAAGQDWIMKPEFDFDGLQFE